MSEPTQPDISALLARLDALDAEVARLKAELARKDKIIAGLQQRLFGSTSEKLDPGQLLIGFEDTVLGKAEPLPEPAGAPGEEKSKAAKSRRSKADRFPKNLPVLIEAVLVPAEVQADPDLWKEAGEEHHDELDITRASMFWRRTVRKKFVHRAERSRPPVIDPAPLPSLPGTLCAPGLAARILVDKHEDHLPHYRQSKRFMRQFGVELGRQTINGWEHAAARHLAPIGSAIKADLLRAEVLQVDETTIKYLDPGHGSTRTGYYWVYRDSLAGTTVYDWRTGRGHECLVEFLGLGGPGPPGFQGVIQCDGFTAYEALAERYDGILLAGCLAHIRRKFVEAKNASPETCLPILLLMQKIYRIEWELRQGGIPPGCRRLIRGARIHPLAKQILKLLQAAATEHLPHGAVGEAVSYALNQWERFRRCLEDGRLELDNNKVENAIRPTKLGAKNWMFIGHVTAGADSALIRTLLENCRVHGLDPEEYLSDVIKRLPYRASEEQAAELTPARYAEARQKAAEVAA